MLTSGTCGKRRSRMVRSLSGRTSDPVPDYYATRNHKLNRKPRSRGVNPIMSFSYSTTRTRRDVSSGDETTRSRGVSIVLK